MGRPVEHKVELERLIVDVVHTLRDALLHDTLRAFDERVLSRSAEDLFERSDEDHRALTFKPMLELLLRELGDLASDTSRSHADRHAHALDVMRLAGF